MQDNLEQSMFIIDAGIGNKIYLFFSYALGARIFYGIPHLVSHIVWNTESR